MRSAVQNTPVLFGLIIGSRLFLMSAALAGIILNLKMSESNGRCWSNGVIERFSNGEDKD